MNSLYKIFAELKCESYNAYFDYLMFAAVSYFLSKYILPVEVEVLDLIVEVMVVVGGVDCVEDTIADII